MKRRRLCEGEETTLACDGAQQAFFGRVGAFLGRAFGFFAFEDAEFPFEAGFFAFAFFFVFDHRSRRQFRCRVDGGGRACRLDQAEEADQDDRGDDRDQPGEAGQVELAAGVFGAVGHHSRHRPGVMLA